MKNPTIANEDTRRSAPKFVQPGVVWLSWVGDAGSGGFLRMTVSAAEALAILALQVVGHSENLIGPSKRQMKPPTPRPPYLRISTLLNL